MSPARALIGLGAAGLGALGLGLAGLPWWAASPPAILLGLKVAGFSLTPGGEEGDDGLELAELEALAAQQRGEEP